MKIKILFSTKYNFFSNLIRSITNESVSHCAIEIPEQNIVIHSTIYGVHIESAINFRKHNKIIYELESTKYYNESFINIIISNNEFKLYDIPAFLFIGFSLILKKYLKIPMPKSNLWNTTGMLCTEWVTTVVSKKSDPMITPYKLFLKLLKSEDWKLI